MVRCQHIMELDQKPVRRGHANCMEVYAHTHIHTSAVNAEGKIQLYVCLGSFGTSVTTFAYSTKKSFYYLKHSRVNNKGLIQLALYLYFLVK